METKFGLGESITAFELPSEDGIVKRLPLEKPTVLVFFRGQWCPYCRWELAGLQTVNRAVNEAGGEIVGVSPDTPQESEELRKRLNLSFNILADSDLGVTDAFGLRHVGGPRCYRAGHALPDDVDPRLDREDPRQVREQDIQGQTLTEGRSSCTAGVGRQR